MAGVEHSPAAEIRGGLPEGGGVRWNSRYLRRNRGLEMRRHHRLQTRAARKRCTGSSGGMRRRASSTSSSISSGSGGGGGMLPWASEGLVGDANWDLPTLVSKLVRFNQVRLTRLAGGPEKAATVAAACCARGYMFTAGGKAYGYKSAEQRNRVSGYSVPRGCIEHDTNIHYQV
ncbi:hypothetical protein EJB05_53352, partial [Eragrostis curvula]